ncbi:oligosaccharide flippase family protein [Pleomorphovibrio marinus]|uniref:oligosaccharide flippase family protein n=1 Tax=Pleomorphovibrio marinus TaxID=2164132 RepID=UPI000E0A483A|nr:polysaccharide biosynthesis C-terminal domain-containing protein [Pleomorphovibrio marinus]
MKGFLDDLLSVVFSKAGIITFGLLKSVILARWLGPELNGTIASLIVFPSLFMAIGSLGIRQSTAYFVGKGIYPEAEIKRSVVQIWMLSTVLSLFTCFVLIRYFSTSGDNMTLVVLAISPIPFSLFNTYNSGYFLGKNQIKKFNKVNWIPPLISLLGALLLVVVLDLSIIGAMFSMIFGPFFMSLIMLRSNGFINGFSFRVEIKVIKSLLSLGVIYAIALLMMNLNYKVDIILLNRLSSDYETGIYSKGSGLIQHLWQIPMMLSTIIFARSATSKNSYAFSLSVVKLLRISIIAIGLASLVMAIGAEWLIQLLFGEAFIPSASVLMYLLPGVLLLTFYKVLNMDMAGRGKPWISLKSMVPALIVNVILNIWLIPGMGANGAAIASTISYSLAALIFLWVYSLEVGIPIREILHFKSSDFKFIKDIQKKRKANIQS